MKNGANLYLASEKPIGEVRRYLHGEMAMKWRINVLCLVGAIVGIAAIFSRWLGNWLVDLNLIDVINLVSSVDAPREYWYASVLVLLGAIIALVSPLGGFLEIIGAPWFILIWSDRHEGAVISNVGPYLAIASAIIVFVSMARPMGLGLMRGPYRLKDRLLVFSTGMGPRTTKRPVASAGPSSDQMAYCAYCGNQLQGAVRCGVCGRPIQKQGEGNGVEPRKRP